MLGVEIFTNGSGSHHELRILHQRIDLICVATKKSGGVYLYSNQQGCDGGRLNFDGCCLISVNGNIVNQGSQFSLKDVEVISSTVDLDQIRMYRMSSNSRNIQSSSINYPMNYADTSENHQLSRNNDVAARTAKGIYVDFKLSLDEEILLVDKPVKQIRYHTPEEEIAYGPAMWCWDYLRRSGGNGFLLPLSGGADSSSTAAIIGCMCQMVVKECELGNEQVIKDVKRITGTDSIPTDAKELCAQIMHTAYLGTSNSSENTQDFAKFLAEEIGTYHLYVNIDKIVSAFLSVFEMVTSFRPKYKLHGGSYAENQALQNIQARVRMVFSYLLAQLLPWVRGKNGWLLVLGSANVDEGLRGYLTKYDCSSADLNPIGGISKSDLKSFLTWASKKENLNYPILQQIVAAPPTAELEPITAEYTQVDEVDMGMTYNELTFYGKLRKVQRCGPVSMFKKLVLEWSQDGVLKAKEVADKVKFFFRMYSINRHKMTTLTPSVHMENYSPEDNRHDLRQIFYNTSWPWQFKKIDELVEKMGQKQTAKI